MQLVRSASGKTQFDVEEMDYAKFLNFAGLFSPRNPLVLRKKDINGDPFKWTEIHWIRYVKEHTNNIFFKYTTNEEEEFRLVDLKRTKNESPLKPNQLYTEKQPIAEEKKKDILDLLPILSSRNFPAILSKFEIQP